MLKMITVAFSFLLGRLNGGGHETMFHPDEIIDKALSRLRELMTSVAQGAVATIFLTAGFLGAFYNLMLQMDTTGKMGPNAVVIGGAVLFAIGLVLFGVASRSTTRQRKPQVQHQAKQDFGHAASPLEEALSMLILDHVKEREYSREFKRQRQSERSHYQEQPSLRDRPEHSSVH